MHDLLVLWTAGAFVSAHFGCAVFFTLDWLCG